MDGLHAKAYLKYKLPSFGHHARFRVLFWDDITQQQYFGEDAAAIDYHVMPGTLASSTWLARIRWLILRTYYINISNHDLR